MNVRNINFRYGICQKKACGESAAVNPDDVAEWMRNVLPKLLVKYEAKNVFNADESGLFFRCLPDKTLTFKEDKCHGGKLSKERVTLLLATNMDGSEKLKILMIGKSEKPRCFRTVKWLPVDYVANSKAWMTGKLFQDWLLKLDKTFTAQGRKVLLFIDNCAAHPPDLKSKLKSIELQYFPPNMTSKLQPLDQGVIANLKCNYRRRILRKTLDTFGETGEIPKLNLLDCIKEVEKAWNIDVTMQTIQNCFQKAGFGQFSEWEDEDEIPLIFLRERVSPIGIDCNNLKLLFQEWTNQVTSGHGVEFQDYLEVDDEVCTSEFPTDEDILESYRPKVSTDLSGDEDDECELQVVAPPLDKAVETALDTLRVYLQTNNQTTDDIYASLNNIQTFFERGRNIQTLRQTQINDYFQSSLNT